MGDRETMNGGVVLLCFDGFCILSVITFSTFKPTNLNMKLISLGQVVRPLRN